MATIVFVHAHPDDEASSTCGSMARASAEGHRVVLVVCTNGEHGESPDDLADGELLVDRRRRETEASAAVLGVARIAWLGYGDSGMTGWEQNAASGLVLAGRSRRGGRAAGHDPARGARRRRRPLRLARWLRPPRPHPGPSGRPSGRRPGRHAEAVRGHVQPRPARPLDGRGARTPPEELRPERPCRRRQPVRARPRPSCTSPPTSPTTSRSSASARRPRQPGHRHRHVPRHARRTLRHVGGDGVVHRAGAPPGLRATAGCSTDGTRPARPSRSGRCRAGTPIPTPGSTASGWPRPRSSPGASLRPPLPIVTSPFRRCRETAAAARPALGRDAGGRAAGR